MTARAKFSTISITLLGALILTGCTPASPPNPDPMKPVALASADPRLSAQWEERGRTFTLTTGVTAYCEPTARPVKVIGKHYVSISFVDTHVGDICVEMLEYKKYLFTIPENAVSVPVTVTWTSPYFPDTTFTLK